MKIYYLIIILLCFQVGSYSTEFDELIKPPEGAYRGQIFLGGFASMGMPGGDLIDAEDKFLEGTTYTFTDSETRKKLMVKHLSFAAGLSFEYMPINYVGVKTKLRRSYIIQRTIFGTQYKNWNGYLYKDLSLNLGPSFHLTTRKQWDITLTPVLGYYYGIFEATPVAVQIPHENTNFLQNYSGSTKRSVNNITYGAELNFTAYFSGGLYITIGFDWTVNKLKFDTEFNLERDSSNTDIKIPYTGSSSNINNYSFIFSAGYAFFN